jgi:hypothetical protein
MLKPTMYPDTRGVVLCGATEDALRLRVRQVAWCRVHPSGVGLSETRSPIAHEVTHLAGARERGARRYEADRRRGAWWATRPELAEPTADD